MKRIILFLLTNFAILIVLSISARILGIDRYLTANGLNLTMLLSFAALIGFGGSFISLLMSKNMAKWSTRAIVIEQPRNSHEIWLKNTIETLAAEAGVPAPEIAVYEGGPNAFATGPSRSNSLVAISSGLLETMNKRQVAAVLAHEIAHVANGDMVTLTLIQGVVNTFVIFISRAAAYIVDSFMRRGNDDHGGGGIGYFLTSIVFELMFGILASIVVMYFSRQREFRADAGAVVLIGDKRPMIEALQVLSKIQSGALPKEMSASGIAGNGLLSLFSSHPPIESRIHALESKI